MILSFRTDSLGQTVFAIPSAVFMPNSMSKSECSNYRIINMITIMILSFRTDRPGQTVKTQIRLLSLIRFYTVCNSLCIIWTHCSMVKPLCSNIRMITANFRMSECLGVYSKAIFRVYKFFVFSRYSPRQCL